MANSNSKYWAVIPAAGIGSRMQQSQPKQYTQVAGKAIIEHSLAALLSLPELELLMVCIAPHDSDWRSLAIAEHPKVSNVQGGATRAQSVLNGLLALVEFAEADDWVLVHDAARPCVKPSTLRRLLETLEQDSVGGILAKPVDDTLKQASALTVPTVSHTLDRSLIWQAQTPQMFRFGMLKLALENALERKLAITDEASAMEHAGHAVRLVEADADNLKITTPADLALAEFLLTR